MLLIAQLQSFQNSKHLQKQEILVWWNWLMNICYKILKFRGFLI